MATFEALKCTALSKQDSLLGVEKGLIQCLGEDDTAGTLSQLTQTLSREGTKWVTTAVCNQAFKNATFKKVFTNDMNLLVPTLVFFIVHYQTS